MFLITGVGDTKPKPIHEVYSNGFALPQASIKYNDSHYSSDFDTTLYISNISFSDAGTYSCSIRTDSKSFELYVIGKEQTSQTLDYPITPLVFLGHLTHSVIVIAIGRWPLLILYCLMPVFGEQFYISRSI